MLVEDVVGSLRDARGPSGDEIRLRGLVRVEVLAEALRDLALVGVLARVLASRYYNS